VHTASDSYKEEKEIEARKLIDNGIDSQNIFEAMEIMLILETEFVPENYEYSDSSLKNWGISLLCLVLIFIILAFTPKSYIDLGKGQKKIKFWKSWIRIISITIPVGILFPILLNKISGIF
jgi:hypothetical protein